MQKEFFTVLDCAVSETEEKKSRFIASVKPVCNEEEAICFISTIKAKYWDATHNVYAYYIVEDSEIQRFSDDGEPAGTAGMPVLEIIRKRNIQNVVIVITRYFGGTLLGAAGLIRAYGKCASNGLDAAKVVIKRLCKQVNVNIEYTLLGKLQSTILNKGFVIKEIIYEQDVEIILYIPIDEVDAFLGLVTETTNSRAVLELKDNQYILLDETGKLILNAV